MSRLFAKKVWSTFNFEQDSVFYGKFCFSYKLCSKFLAVRYFSSKKLFPRNERTQDLVVQIPKNEFRKGLDKVTIISGRDEKRKLSSHLGTLIFWKLWANSDGRKKVVFLLVTRSISTFECSILNLWSFIRQPEWLSPGWNVEYWLRDKKLSDWSAASNLVRARLHSWLRRQKN